MNYRLSHTKMSRSDKFGILVNSASFKTARFIAPHLPVIRLDSPTRRSRPVEETNSGYQTLQHHRRSIPNALQQINGCFTLDRFAGRKKRNRPMSQSIISSVSTAAFPIKAFESLSTITGWLNKNKQNLLYAKICATRLYSSSSYFLPSKNCR